MSKHTYPAVGRCIYCGSTDNLTLEHIIPFGLGGRYELPDASCDDCREITRSFEEDVLRGGMWAARRSLGIKGRKRKEKPRELFEARVFDIYGKTHANELHVSKHLAPVVTPIFPMPDLFTGRDNRTTFNFNFMHVAIAAKDEAAIAREFGDLRVTVNYHLDAIAYGRMLAKIAHGYAVALFGLDGFTPFLNDHIRGKRADLGRYIGTWDKLEPRRTETHVLACTYGPLTPGYEGPVWVRVHVRLFSKLDTPTQVVIAGELSRDAREKAGASWPIGPPPGAYRNLFEDPRVIPIRDHQA